MVGVAAMGVLVLILLSLCCLISGKAAEFSEISQLLELKNAIVDHHNMLSTWKSSNPNHCSWFGITCNSHGRISELRIPGGNFVHSGSCLSSKYSDLALHGSGIVRDCSSLKKGRFLGGKLSNVIGKFSELRVLSFPFNEFRGELPNGVWGLTKLEVIDIEGNSITANLSTINFKNLKNLQVFNLGFNKLFGEIPNSLSECEALSFLSLAGNQIEGYVPDFLGNFVKLKGINLSSNQFIGSLPHEFWNNCRVLEHVDFSSNFLTGKIPKSFGNCSNLRAMFLFSNGFSGVLPFELSNLQMLEVLDVSRNRISGVLDEKLHVRCMRVFDVSRNLMFGSIPDFINPCHLNISRHSDPVAKYLSHLTHKTRVETRLPFSRFTPATIHDFSDNNFTGPIPLLPMISRTGKKIDYAFLAGGNKLSSGLFRENPFKNCHNLNRLFINVSNNVISDRIPSNVGVNWECLKFLDASKNQIAGEIPKSLVNLRNLTALLLNNNKLSGEIPSGFLKIKFNFSFNNLSGSITMDRNSINCKNFIGNPLLHRCQLISLSSVPSQEPLALGFESLNSTVSSDSNQRKKGSKYFELILIIVPSVIIIILVALILIYLYQRKKKPTSEISGISLPPPRSPPPPPPPPRSPHHCQQPVVVFKEIGVQLTLDKVVQATGNFTSRNCIGSGGFGSTYRAEISPGTIVAVKRLTVEMCQGVPQFNAEIRSLGRIRHPNLVTLIGYYASPSEMFLIYNYLPGGNLEKFIRERPVHALGWNVIHKIALGIGNALSFLHDQCKPRILHRDVKPSNILLDEEFNAYLSDFGLARLLDDFETHVTTGVAGTFGYVAPEYALTCRASEKADVYSYGVMLLELISDKRALDSSFSSQENGYTIVSWAWMLRREGRPEEVFTAGLWEAGPEDVLLELLHLGLVCTGDSVTGRPTMRQVVRKLKQIQPV
ncbi:unnamed protein product [Lactuca saligna]|uniref:non-specific serine/threonine protein kinase n=1 Tax=Lactuca saligna TaxID=75948 RepID=A0AA36DYA4_LACSI|nr:unnamed protein product [Lactuca saligna]